MEHIRLHQHLISIINKSNIYLVTFIVHSMFLVIYFFSDIFSEAGPRMLLTKVVSSIKVNDVSNMWAISLLDNFSKCFLLHLYENYDFIVVQYGNCYCFTVLL